jgi:mRNA interferase MazF
MNARPSRGEIWQVDMGIAGKVRPCLLLTDYPANDELALVTVVPHTTALRGNEWEVAIPKSFLKEGAFHIQQVQSISLPKLMRRFGSLTHEEWNMISAKLAKRLGLVF